MSRCARTGQSPQFRVVTEGRDPRPPCPAPPPRPSAAPSAPRPDPFLPQWTPCSRRRASCPPIPGCGTLSSSGTAFGWSPPRTASASGSTAATYSTSPTSTPNCDRSPAPSGGGPCSTARSSPSVTWTSPASLAFNGGCTWSARRRRSACPRKSPSGTWSSTCCRWTVKRSWIGRCGGGGRCWGRLRSQAPAGRCRRRTSARAWRCSRRRGNRLEGMVAKRLDSVYEPGRRSPAWRKVKIVRRQEFVVGGWVPQEGGHRVGALLLGYYDCGGRLRFAGGVGSGFNDADHDPARPVPGHARAASPFAEPLPARGMPVPAPQLVAEVEFLRWPEGGLVQQAAFKGLRPDKDRAGRGQGIRPPRTTLHPTLHARGFTCPPTRPILRLPPRPPAPLPPAPSGPARSASGW